MGIRRQLERKLARNKNCGPKIMTRKSEGSEVGLAGYVNSTTSQQFTTSLQSENRSI